MWIRTRELNNERWMWVIEGHIQLVQSCRAYPTRQGARRAARRFIKLIRAAKRIPIED